MFLNSFSRVTAAAVSMFRMQFELQITKVNVSIRFLLDIKVHSKNKIKSHHLLTLKLFQTCVTLFPLSTEKKKIDN